MAAAQTEVEVEFAFTRKVCRLGPRRREITEPQPLRGFIAFANSGKYANMFSKQKCEEGEK